MSKLKIKELHGKYYGTEIVDESGEVVQKIWTGLGRQPSERQMQQWRDGFGARFEEAMADGYPSDCHYETQLDYDLAVRLAVAELEECFTFRNFYRCPEDGSEWTMEWSSMCDDKCPKCHHEIEPYKSEDVEQGKLLAKVSEADANCSA